TGSATDAPLPAAENDKYALYTCSPNAPRRRSAPITRFRLRPDPEKEPTLASYDAQHLPRSAIDDVHFGRSGKGPPAARTPARSPGTVPVLASLPRRARGPDTP